jgi:hypothetical protein
VETLRLHERLAAVGVPIDRDRQSTSLREDRTGAVEAAWDLRDLRAIRLGGGDKMASGREQQGTRPILPRLIHLFPACSDRKCGAVVTTHVRSPNVIGRNRSNDNLHHGRLLPHSRVSVHFDKCDGA